MAVIEGIVASNVSNVARFHELQGIQGYESGAAPKAGIPVQTWNQAANPNPENVAGKPKDIEDARLANLRARMNQR